MRILIVEDEPDFLRTLSQAMREDGYAVDEAEMSGMTRRAREGSGPYLSRSPRSATPRDATPKRQVRRSLTATADGWLGECRLAV